MPLACVWCHQIDGRDTGAPAPRPGQAELGVLAFVLKLTLASGLVAAASLVARRAGPRAAGLLSGLPVVAAPIVLVYAVERGVAFAPCRGRRGRSGHAVVSRLLRRLRSRRAQRVAMAAQAAAWTAFIAATAALIFTEVPLPLAAATTLAVLALGTRLLAHIAGPSASARAERDLLAWRLALTAALVWP